MLHKNVMGTKEEQHYQSEIKMGTKPYLLPPMLDTEEEQHYQSELKMETKPHMSRKY